MMGLGNDEVLTLQEYIDRETALEAEARETLPGKFDECTYHLGYINQPIYVCLGCLKDNGKPAAICYACSISCHTRCDLIELNGRRGFRCDCGNSKFKSTPS